MIDQYEYWATVPVSSSIYAHIHSLFTDILAEMWENKLI